MPSVLDVAGLNRRTLRARPAGPSERARAAFVPGSLQDGPEGSLTFRAVIASTGVVTRVGDFGQGWGRFEEVLSFEPGAHRSARIDSGRCPVVTDHNVYSVDRLVGVLSAPVWRSTELEVTVRVSGVPELASLRQKIREGVLSSFSIGYLVHQYRDVTEKGAARRRLLAIDWEIHEATLLAAPADPAASIRSHASTDEELADLWTPETANTRAMDPETPAPQNTPAAQAPVTPAAPVAGTRAVDAGGGAGQPAASPAPAAPAVNPAPAPTALAPAGRSAADELARQRGIRGALTRARLPLDGELAVGLLDDPNVGVDAASTRILAHLSGADDAAGITSRVAVGDQEGDKVLRALEDAFALRMMPDQLTPEERRALDTRAQGNLFAHSTLLEMGTEYLERVHGQRGVARLPKYERARTILHTRRELSIEQRSSSVGYHTSGDFGSVLANVAHKSMRRAYDLVPETWSQWTSRGVLTDFKQALRPQLSEAARLKKVLEGAEYRYGRLADTGEPIILAKYGRIVPLSWEAMVNDDLGAFARLTRSFGGMAMQLVADLVYAHLTGNTVMADGLALFHSTHGNLVTGSGNALGVTGLSNLRKLARAQKALSSGDPDTTNDAPPFISVNLVHLRVPVGLETTAQQLTAAIQPALVGSVNPFVGSFRSVMAEPRLGVGAETAFYAAADPSVMETIEVAYLQGESGPVIEQRVGFNTDGVEVKCRIVVGTGPMEHRGLYKNEGTT